ncbi:dynamin family protein [Actinomycetospora sp. CA-053990]|uniref:dynamin family protein n=1 Tax=Actinomycetospora sp. CA-053990 TaxID=3239891 RepID=UPI003D8BAE85
MTAQISASARLARTCDELLARGLPPHIHGAIADVRRELGRPLRLAVVGRVKSGKSTLVNALLGQRVARVDASECTRAVTWFSYGHQEQVVVHARDGRSWTRAFAPDGFLPADLGAAPEEIDAVEVVLCNAALAGLTVIDTPGLDSLTADAGARTDAFLGLDGASRHALSVADAVLFLVPQLTRDDDRRLRALADAMGRTVAASGFSPATVLAVVSKADTLDGEAEDPWPAAVALATHYGDQLQGVAAGVLPVIGLLAEAADAALVTEDVADALRRLALLPPDDRELLMLSADLFTTTPDVGVGEAERVRLLDLLGLHGVQLCLGWLDQGHQGAHALTKQLHAASGVDALHDTVRRLFTAQADAIAAHRALVALERLVYVVGATPSMRDAIEEAREDTALQHLRERDVFARWSRGELELPEALAADLHHLAVGTDVPGRLGVDPLEGAVGRDVLARRALDGATRWLRFGNAPGTNQAARRAAEVVRDSYTAMWETVGGAS